MKPKINKASRLQAYLYSHIEASPLSQKDMAAAVGYANPNMITMLKQGDAKLALDRVPAFAAMLGVDPRHLFALALEAHYGFENANAIMTVLGGPALEPIPEPAPESATD